MKNILLQVLKTLGPMLSQLAPDIEQMGLLVHYKVIISLFNQFFEDFFPFFANVVLFFKQFVIIKLSLFTNLVDLDPRLLDPVRLIPLIFLLDLFRVGCIGLYLEINLPAPVCECISTPPIV